MAGQPIVTDIGQGVGLTTPAPAVRTVKVLLSPLLQDGLEDFSVGITEVPPHGEGTRHNHPTAAEVWLFFAGRGRAIVGDREYPTGPGTVVYTPPGTFHQFVNTGDEPVKLYFLYVPAGEAQAILDAEFR